MAVSFSFETNPEVHPDAWYYVWRRVRSATASTDSLWASDSAQLVGDTSWTITEKLDFPSQSYDGAAAQLLICDHGPCPEPTLDGWLNNPDSGEVNWGAQIWASVDPPQLGTVTATGTSSIELTWTNAHAGGTHYRTEIFRDGSFLDSVPGSIVSYEDTGLNDGATYHHKVRHASSSIARVAFGLDNPASPFSASDSATTDPIPTLTASIDGPDAVKPNETCVWSSVVSGGDGSYAYDSQ